PGVFTVFTTAQEHIIRELDYLKMGKGPNYLLYTPYHLGNIESPLSIYDVAVDNKATLTVKGDIVTMVCARAKKNIGKGDRLDRIGGYCFSGIALDWVKNMDKGYIPLALAENGVAGREIKKGQVIKVEDMVTHKDSYLYTMYNMQQKMGY
ncbi:MAG: NAD(P)H-dependent oxidoreductase, partial [Actinomycetota bacterium]